MRFSGVSTGVGRARAPVQVYRALNFLESMGLVHRVASSNAYVACYRLTERHGAVLFVCKACGVVMEGEKLELESMMDQLARKSGFTIHSRLLEPSDIAPIVSRKQKMPAHDSGGSLVRASSVGVHRGGRWIIHDVNLEIRPAR